MPLMKWIIKNDINQEECGLSKIDNMMDLYLLYHGNGNKYRGIVSKDSNELRLSEIPKGIEPRATVYFNKDGYSVHCKKYGQYVEWLEKRNVQRYVDVSNHGQMIDGKNLLHCVRLIDTAIEIATEKTINVRRPNAEHLINIRRGVYSLEDIIKESEDKLALMVDLFDKSDLPETCDLDEVNQLLLAIRKNSY